MITREFNLYLHAGHSIPLVINVNQYDHGEQWLFTLFNSDGTQYVPSSGAIVGIKSDNLGIINTGSVDAQGRVAINETQQMTAAVGKAVFELLIDDQSHGTANFIVLVEPKPGDNADLSETDISMIEQAIEAASTIKPYGSPLVASTVAGMTDHEKVYVYVGSETGYTSGNWYYWDGSAWTSGGVYNSVAVQTDTTLTLSGVAADSKKVGDELNDLKSQITQSSGLTEDVKQALLACFENIGGLYLNGNARTYIENLRSALYPPASLSSISAVYTQSGDVYASTPLDNLKADLVVTAHYSDGTSGIVTNYSLSGTLAEGTSTITVTYSGETTTFTVIVTASQSHNLPSEYQEVEWVANKTNSLGVLISNFSLPSAFRLEAKTQLQGWNTNATYGNIAAVFQPGATSYGYELAYKKDDSTIVSFLGAQSIVTPSDINAELVVGTICDGSTEKAYVVVNNERVYGSEVAVSRNYTGRELGVFYGGNSALNQLVGKLWYLNVYDSSENLIAEIVPCYRKSDTKIGLYDTVSNSFYYKVGGVDAKLKKGDDVL